MFWFVAISTIRLIAWSLRTAQEQLAQAVQLCLDGLGGFGERIQVLAISLLTECIQLDIQIVRSRGSLAARRSVIS